VFYGRGLVMTCTVDARWMIFEHPLMSASSCSSLAHH
jgi:hypothetical protein